MINVGKAFGVKHWDPPPIGWLKWITKASKISVANGITISYVCRDSTGRIQKAYGKKIGDYTILVTETLSIRKVLEMIIHEKLSNVIIESLDCDLGY